MNECNYPVKYAVLPLYNVDGRDGFGWKTYDVMAYVVTKVYLLGETKIYNDDGSLSFVYKVFFPYMSYEEIIRNKRHNIECNDIRKWDYNQYINSVSDVYETYEEARKAADLRNQERFRHPLKEEYLDLQNMLLELTNDMEITKQEVLDKEKTIKKIFIP